ALPGHLASPYLSGDRKVLTYKSSRLKLISREAETNTLLEGPQVKVKSNEKTSLATSEASITSSTKRKPYLMSAVKSFGKS
ncbi:hypothetical protein ACHAWT_002027, partial [Skeletonema menzelii]